MYLNRATSLNGKNLSQLDVLAAVKEAGSKDVHGLLDFQSNHGFQQQAYTLVLCRVLLIYKPFVRCLPGKSDAVVVFICHENPGDRG